MNEEQYIIEKAGRRNPFSVPEGYFDTLASQVMSRVDAEGIKPQEKSQDESKKAEKARVVWFRPLFYSAASVCALFVSVTAYQHFTSSEPAATAPVEATAYSEDSFDEAADYVMIDNQDIYACLMGE